MWEVTEVFFSPMSFMFGKLAEPRVVRTFRWHWLARTYAFINTTANPLGIWFYEVRRRRPALRVIQGGKAA